MTDTQLYNANEDPKREDSDEMPNGIISWFAQNPVAANLLMIFIIIAGLMSYLAIQKQMFPNIEINYINAHVSYPGASPKEIEENIVKKIEENIKDITEIEKSIGRSWRGGGRVTMEIDPDVHLPDVLNKIKARIDGIATFPASMEPVNVAQIEWNQQVIEMTLTADMDLQALKPIAKQIEQELLQLNNVQIAEAQLPEDEIAIEVIPEMLRKYDLSINDITQSIRRYSANYSAGRIRSDAGTIAVRIENQYYSGNEFRQIPVKVGNNGAKVYLQDVAIIKDDFTEGERYFKYNGENAIYLNVSATKSQNIIPVAKSVTAYVEERNKTLPQGVQLNVMVDTTYYLNGRLNMMLSNLAQGAILVFIMLAVFLRFKLAFWVMIGLPVCFLGAIAMMSVFGISINIISLFAFIMVLGIVVDDAIVIGESAYTEIEKSGMSPRNVVIGAKKVALPATFGVLTTIAAFAPFMMSSGPQGDFFINIAGVVVLCLIFSLIESKLILPAHIAHTKFKPLAENSWRHKFNRAFFGFVNGKYRRFIERCTAHRWPTLGFFVGMLILSGFFISSSLVRQVDEPKVPHDFPRINIEMSETVSDETVINAIKTVEEVVMQVEQDIIDEYGTGMIRDRMVWNSFDNSGTLMTPLVDEEDRPFNTFELARRWREAMPKIAGMKSFTVQDDVAGDGGGEGEFGYLIFGSDIEQLNQAGRFLIEKLQQEKGLYDISSTIDPASKELQLKLKPVAFDLGLDLNILASQVGASFYGGEAQRILRNGEEVRVMVRYPKLTRERYADLKHTVIQTPSGAEVLLGDVAELIEVPGISYIRREGGYRSVYVWGAIDEEAVEPFEAINRIKEDILPEVTAAFPSVKTELGGKIQEQQSQQLEQLKFLIILLLAIYILLAIPLKSYGQPLIIMSVIPFSFTGAVFGHYLLGLDLSQFSNFGLIAAFGVVVNDSLVMTDFVNQRRKQGMSIKAAVIDAGCARFRAIILTSITTFVGVLPIMFETSLQAAFVIPMAVALGFAVLYATLVTLVLIPCLYLIFDDIKVPFRFIKQKLTRKEKTTTTPQQV